MTNYGGHGRRRHAVAYVVLSIAFWALVWAAGGEASTGGGTSIIRIDVMGAVINFAFLPAAIRGSRPARYVLIAEALVLALVIASVGVPPVGPPFGLLVVFPAAQVVLLLSIGWTGRPRDVKGPAPVQPR
jgi:hypothetical protein